MSRTTDAIVRAQEAPDGRCDRTDYEYLSARVAALEADARRLDWLEANRPTHARFLPSGVSLNYGGWSAAGPDLRTAINRAMNATGDQP